MSLYRLWAIIRKEFRHILRDGRLLFLVTVSPAIMLVAFAYLFSFDSAQVRIAVFDRDRSPQSRQLIHAIEQNSDLIFVGEVARDDDLKRQLQAGTIKLGLVIPPGFGEKLMTGQSAEVQVLGDGTDPINTSTQMAALSAQMGEWGEPYRRVQLAAPIEVRSLVWYNPFVKSSDSMVPGLIAIVLILPGMAVALALTREKELGSFETLATTPVKATEYVLGKLIPYLLFGLVGAGLAVAVAFFWFHVPFRGNFVTLVLALLVYLWAILGLSIFFSSFMSTQSTALRAILLLFLVPSIFLSGLLIPSDPNARLVAGSLPATHFVVISRGLFLKGLDVRALGFQMFMLIALGAVPTALTILTFRKRVG